MNSGVCGGARRCTRVWVYNEVATTTTKLTGCGLRCYWLQQWSVCLSVCCCCCCENCCFCCCYCCSRRSFGKCECVCQKCPSRLIGVHLQFADNNNKNLLWFPISGWILDLYKFSLHFPCSVSWKFQSANDFWTKFSDLLIAFAHWSGNTGLSSKCRCIYFSLKKKISSFSFDCGAGKGAWKEIECNSDVEGSS